MRRYENECVGCPAEMGCLGDSCPYWDVPRDYCDFCGEDGAVYKIDGEDYCEYCARAYLREVFDNLTTTEKAEALEVDINIIDN